MFERFARDTRAAVVHAVDESRLLGDRRISTCHLLLGLFHDRAVAGAFRATVEQAREATHRLDMDSLRAIGLNVSESTPAWACTPAQTRAPFSTGAKGVLSSALKHAASERCRTLEPRHLAIAILDLERPDPAAALLIALGVDAHATRSRLVVTHAA